MGRLRKAYSLKYGHPYLSELVHSFGKHDQPIGNSMRVLKVFIGAVAFSVIGVFCSYQEQVMKAVVFLILILVLTACTITNTLTNPVINTDSIAGNWSGEVTGKLVNGDELPPRDVRIIIIADCSTGEVCGKLAEDDQCPGDIILLDVVENRYSFIAETKSGTRHICGEANITSIELELRPDGTLYFGFHNGATLTGILKRK